MRDLALLGLVLGLAALAFYRAWLGVLAFAIVGYLNPHAYGEGAMREFPAFALVLACTALAAAWTRDRQPLPRDWRLLVLLLLWLGFLWSTLHSEEPWLAWPRLGEVTKVYAGLLLTLLLINTHDKLLALIVTIAACIFAVVLKGGYWGLINGFVWPIYGPPGSQYADNNHFAVAIVMSLPLILLWRSEVSGQVRRWLLALFLALTTAAVVGTWSRGGMLALVGVLILFPILSVWPLKSMVLLTAAGVVTLGLLWISPGLLDEMMSLSNFEADASAQGRLTAWRDGLDLALENPITGLGFEGWIGQTVLHGRVGRDWHSIYVEILAEHGVVVFALWLLLLVGSLFSLVRLRWRLSSSIEGRQIAAAAGALSLAIVAYAIGGAFVGISYWDLYYQLVVLSILLGQFAGALSERPVSRGAEPCRS